MPMEATWECSPKFLLTRITTLKGGTLFIWSTALRIKRGKLSKSVAHSIIMGLMGGRVSQSWLITTLVCPKEKGHYNLLIGVPLLFQWRGLVGSRILSRYLEIKFNKYSRMLTGVLTPHSMSLNLKVTISQFNSLWSKVFHNLLLSNTNLKEE